MRPVPGSVGMTIDELGAILNTESDKYKCYDAAVRCALSEHTDIDAVYRRLRDKGYNYNKIILLTSYRPAGNTREV